MFNRTPPPAPEPRTPLREDYVTLYESLDRTRAGRSLPEPPPLGEPLTPAHIAAYRAAVAQALQRRYGTSWE